MHPPEVTYDEHGTGKPVLLIPGTGFGAPPGANSSNHSRHATG
jgi:hypothetical protein